MARSRGVGRSSTTGSPGFFGGLGLGVVSNCDSEDDSFFCQFSRFVQVITMIATLLAIVYFAYMFFKPYVSKKKR